MDEGNGQVPAPLPVPHRRRGADRAARAALLLAHARGVRRRHRSERRLRPRAARRRGDDGRATSTRRGCSRSRAEPARSTSSARSKGRSSTASTPSRATRTTSGSRWPRRSCSCCRSTCVSSAAIACACRSPCLLAFLTIVDLATLSRSGLLGLGCGFLVLAVPYRRMLLQPRVPRPARAAPRRAHRRSSPDAPQFFAEVLSSRLSTEGRGADTHFIVYSFIPDVLAQNPLFGLGLNTFSVYYEFQTGKTNFGPHSFYVASFVEYGLVGTLVFAAFLVYLFRRAGLTRRIGRALAAAGDPLAARIRPLGWGLAAALVAHDGLERLLPDDVLLLLLRARAARDRRAGCARAPPRPSASEGRRPDDVVPARRGRRRGDVRARRRRGAARRRASRCGSSRLRASATTGSPTATGSSTTCAARPGSCSLAAALPPLVRERGPPGEPRRGRRPRPLAARAPCRRSPRASRSCSSSGARTSHSRRRVRPLARWLVRRAPVVVCASTRSPTMRARSARATSA